MKSKIVWFAIIFTLVNQLFSQQNKIVVSKNKHQFFNQTVTFNPTVEKFFRVMECSQSNAYSADQINKIQLRLKQNFSESKVVQAALGDKIVFVTNKIAIATTNGSIQEYIKSILLELNLYNGFTEIKEYNLELN